MVINLFFEIVIAFFGSFFYILSTFSLGTYLLNFVKKKIKFDFLYPYIAFFFGVLFLFCINLLFGLLNLYNHYYFYFLLLLQFIFFIILIKKYALYNIKFFKIYSQIKSIYLSSIFNRILLLVNIFVLLIIFSYCFSSYTGADLGIYHLPYLSEMIRDKGIFYKFNWFASGYNLTWQVFGISSYYFFGINGYLGLTFWVYILFAFFFIQIIKEVLLLDFEKQFIGISFFQILLLIFINDSIPNNDIPILFFQLLLFTLLIRNIINSKNINNDKFFLKIHSLISGFLVSIKLTSIPLVAILNIYLFIFKKPRYLIVKYFLLYTLPLAIFWQIFNFMSAENFSANILASFIDNSDNNILKSANLYVENIHSNWFIYNFIPSIFRFFYFPIMFICLFFYYKKIKINYFQKYFLIFSILYYFLFISIVPRADIYLHNRYHLIVLLGLIFFLVANLDLIRHIIFYRILRVPLLLFLFIFSLISPTYMYFPDASDNESKINILRPFIFQPFDNYYQQFKKLHLDNSDSTYFINYKTENDSIIATQSMNIYLFNKKTIQINPLSAKTIFLDHSIDNIIDSLENLGVNYIHLTPFPGFVPGLSSKLEKFNQNLNDISKSKRVLLVYERKLQENKYERIYKINKK